MINNFVNRVSFAVNESSIERFCTGRSKTDTQPSLRHVHFLCENPSVRAATGGGCLSALCIGIAMTKVSCFSFVGPKWSFKRMRRPTVQRQRLPMTFVSSLQRIRCHGRFLPLGRIGPSMGSADRVSLVAHFEFGGSRKRLAISLSRSEEWWR